MATGALLARRAADGASSGPPAAVLHSAFEADGLGLADLAAVSSWTDTTGNGRHAVQATGANQPIYRTGIVNSLPAIRFTPTQWVRQAAFSAISQPNTVIVVYKAEVVTANAVLVDGIALGNRHLAYTPSAWNWGTSGLIAAGAVDTSWHIRSFEFNGATGVARQDGVQVGSTGNVGAHTLTGLTVGASYAGNLAWNGWVAALNLYTAALLTTAEHNAVGSALATKYGTTWTPIP